MATEIHSTNKQRRAPRLFSARLRLRARPRLPRFLARALRVICALVIVAGVAGVAAFAYLYSHYSKIVDERLASGYLTSRAGIYAAPRVLRAGQRLTPYALAEILRRAGRSEEHTSELQSRQYLVCRLLLEKKNASASLTPLVLSAST